MQVSDARVLIVATDGFEEWELFGPRQILQQRGAEVVLASLKRDPIQATIHDDPGKTIRPDLTIDEANADDFDALILPGGVRNPDQLRIHGDVIALIRTFAEQGKPVGAICHGPWLLVEADLVRDRTATSWPSIRTDLRNAGALVVDEPAVTDGNIVTSRNPDDVEAFTNAIIDLIENQPEVDGDPPPERAPGLDFLNRLETTLDVSRQRCMPDLLAKVEKNVDRLASTLFAAACGYALYSWLAGSLGQSALAMASTAAAALAFLISGRALGAVQPQPRRLPVPIFDVREVEPIEEPELLLTERLRAAAAGGIRGCVGPRRYSRQAQRGFARCATIRPGSNADRRRAQVANRPAPR